MPKHKKTRAQKIKADERNTATLAAQTMPTAPSYVFSAKNISSSVVKQPTSVNVLTLIQHDLRKTAIISLVIVALQILFFFLLKTHMLAIGFVRY